MSSNKYTFRDRSRTWFDTLCSHAGQGSGDGEPLVSPIVQSTTFARSHVGSDPTHQYSRVSNPTVAALEEHLARLEGVRHAHCFSTGLAAETALFLALLKSGDHLICGRSVYGGTTRLLEQLFPGFGIEITFVDSRNLEEVRLAFRKNTKLVFIETPSNPTLELTDVSAISELCRSEGALLAVDNTFLTPVLQQPLELGADISVYSTTKFIEGHSVALGGALVTGRPEVSDRICFVRKSTGAIQTPFNAWLTLQGLKTLPLRVRHQSSSAQRVAEWLSERSEVRRVFYPSLCCGSDYAIAQKQHLGAHGAVVSFELDVDFEQAKSLAQHIKLLKLVEHVGSVESLLTHSASMTHAELSPGARKAIGISDSLFRVSIGLESVESIIDELSRAISLCSRSQVPLQSYENGCSINVGGLQ